VLPVPLESLNLFCAGQVNRQEISKPLMSTVISQTRQTINIFISYSSEDEKWLEKLETHLASLKNSSKIQIWHVRSIEPGAERDSEIKKLIEKSQIILLLISPDFLASDECYKIQLPHAIQCREERKIKIIPIILRPTDWESSDCSVFNPLPKNRKPITEWEEKDKAFLSIAKEIGRIISSETNKSPIPLVVKVGKERITRHPFSRIWRISGFFLVLLSLMAVSRSKIFDEPVQALFSVSPHESLNDLIGAQNTHQAEFFYLQGDDQFKKGNFQSAIAYFTTAITLNSNYKQAYMDRGLARRKIEDHEGAIKDFEVVVKLDPESHYALNNLCAEKWISAMEVEPISTRIQELYLAFDYCKKSINLEKDYPNSYVNAGSIKLEIARAGNYRSYSEAIKYFENAASLYLQQGADHDYQSAIEKANEIKSYLEGQTLTRPDVIVPRPVHPPARPLQPPPKTPATLSLPKPNDESDNDHRVWVPRR
jgi:tetratricopeptide (TPR) repeat protein